LGERRPQAEPGAEVKFSAAMTELFGSNPFNILPHLVALLVAYALAVPIGWNREHEERSAGLRTFPLVAVATCGFIQASESLFIDHPEAIARVLEGLITGMGFIGGGAILRHHESVKGTATAASLWITGAIGAAVGLGSYDVAIVLSILTMATLWIMSPLKRLGRGKEELEKGANRKRGTGARRSRSTTG
jgi:putative Mg2+ transporter-C (MgtC) family protein